jgi:ribosome-binding ATPase YchF (GTP1/OBG family)
MIYAFNVDEVDYTFGRDQAEQNARSVLERVEYCDPTKDKWTLVSAKLDAKLSLLSQEEQVQYWSELGLVDDNKDGSSTELSLSSLRCHEVLPKLVQEILHLGVVYTGPGVPSERSRTIKAHLFLAEAAIATALQSDNKIGDRGGRHNHKVDLTTTQPAMRAKDLAGRLHGDIQKGFICAEVIPASILLQHSNYVAAKESGCVRVEGKDYTLQPNDVVLVKWK